jgi:hypothetical protein
MDSKEQENKVIDETNLDIIHNLIKDVTEQKVTEETILDIVDNLIKDISENKDIIENNVINDLEKEFTNLNKKKSNSKSNFKKHDDRHYINESGKIFASASLTFTHSKKGYLLCNEYRYYEKKNLYHLTGGKTELYDIDILYTACREFVEETNLYMNKSASPDKNILILTNKMYINIKNKVKYWDLCVNPNKRLFHRFFTFDINKFDYSAQWLRTEIITLPGFMNMLKLSNNNDNKELNDLIWINNENIDTLKNEFSYMLNTFYSNIDKYINYKN